MFGKYLQCEIRKLSMHNFPLLLSSQLARLQDSRMASWHSVMATKCLDPFCIVATLCGVAVKVDGVGVFVCVYVLCACVCVGGACQVPPHGEPR